MIDFRIQQSWSRFGFDIWLIERRAEGKSFIAKPIELVFEPIDGGSLLPTPTLQIDGIYGQELLQAAQRAMAGVTWLNKEEIDVSSKIQKSMQAHIDSLKFVIERTVK